MEPPNTLDARHEGRLFFLCRSSVDSFATPEGLRGRAKLLPIPGNPRDLHEDRNGEKIMMRKVTNAENDDGACHAVQHAGDRIAR